MRRRWLIGLTILLLLGGGVYMFFPRDYSATAKGSPEYAAEWKAAFEQLSGPEEAQSKYADVEAKRFANGERVFGVCRDSHRYRNGGTVVVKDSTGAVRAFFGHVCGGSLLQYGLQEAGSLREFYGAQWWQGFGFSEFTYP